MYTHEHVHVHACVCPAGAAASGPDGLPASPPPSRQGEDADGGPQVWHVPETGQVQRGTGQERTEENKTQELRYNVLYMYTCI